MKVCTIEEMRSMDRSAVEQYAVPEELLMENAGTAVYRVLQQRVGVPGHRFVVL